MWEHELPLSKTPIPAARDSIVHHATRVTRLMDLDCNRIAIITIDETALTFYPLKVLFPERFLRSNAAERKDVSIL